MAEPAAALLALWNDVDPAVEATYNEWHAREHVPERCTVPGILWGRRYARVSGPMPARYLTLYGLRDAAVLDSEPYQRLLLDPTPMSRTMRPALRNVARWVCDVCEQGAWDAGRHLAVWTSLQAMNRMVPGNTLVARRRDDAKPLPWVGAGQVIASDADGFVAMALDLTAFADTSLVEGRTIYLALPRSRCHGSDAQVSDWDGPWAA